ncbi:kinesin-like protein KIFC3 isoform X2 [Acropora muricata]
MQATALGNSLAVEVKQDSKNEKESTDHTANEKITKDGGHVSRKTAISSSEITVCPIVAKAMKALYEHMIAVYNSYVSLRKALIEHLVSFCRAIPHYVLGNHSICGSWCLYKYPIMQKHRSLYYGKDLDGYDFKAELEQAKTLAVLSDKTKEKLDYIIAQSKEIEELLSKARPDRNANEIPALLSDVKPLRKNTSKSGKSEQKTLAECSSFSNPGLESKIGENEGLIQGLESELPKYREDIERLEELLLKTRCDYDTEVSALQSEIKSLQKNLKECTENEQRTLAEYRTLQEAIKDKKELEATLQKKEVHITALETEINSYQTDIEQLQDLLAETRSEYDAKISALQSDMRSLKTKMKECIKNEQRALAECRTLQKAVEHKNELELTLMKREDHIKALEAEVVKKALTDANNKVLQTKYTEEMLLRKHLHNELVALRGNIRVYCRVRPVIKEDGNGEAARNVITFDKDDDGILNVVSQDSPRSQKFVLDKVFKPDSTQEQVFEEVKSLIVSCIDGYNVCLFAYGQTGSGKTFTMEGSQSNPGINQRAITLLFEETRDRGVNWQFTINVSVLEIYNEMLRDLLGEDPSQKLEIRKGPSGLFVPGLTEKEVKTVEDVNEIFATGKTHRTTATTDMNEHSSRSHALLCVTVIGENQTTGQRTTGKLNLVDLAGSEKISKSGVEGARMTEAVNINISLSCLGKVIHSLKNKNSHIPYRDSKLTYLLQESLGGDSKTLMVVQVSPVEKNLTETVYSLHFAQGVRTVELGQATRRIASAERKKKRPRERAGIPVTPSASPTLARKRFVKSANKLEP